MDFFPEDALEEPNIDFLENNNNLIVKANMSGYNKNDIKIEYDDVRKMLKISGEARLTKDYTRQKDKFDYLTTIPANVIGQPHAKFYEDSLEIVFNIDKTKPEMHVTNIDIE